MLRIVVRHRLSRSADSVRSERRVRGAEYVEHHATEFLRAAKLVETHFGRQIATRPGFLERNFKTAKKAQL